MVNIFLPSPYPPSLSPPFPPLSQGLEGTIEKISPSLNVNAVYNKTSRVSRLPAYLTVQYMRFHVGKAATSDEMIAKKILKVRPFSHALLLAGRWCWYSGVV